ncbi:hypothetical protein [Streptomyces sp. NPDC096324]|uniref:hypothetical protein n=1 Tax=Streptomyces sp. NPDC096324 TaxID=3366085 RepID=UPI00382EDB27
MEVDAPSRADCTSALRFRAAQKRSPATGTSYAAEGFNGGRTKVVPSRHVFNSPTGRRVHDNRHTRPTKWLNDGIPPSRVADRAGNSVPVLLATYARCVEDGFLT